MKQSDIEVGKVYGSRPFTPPEHREVLHIDGNGEVTFRIAFDSRTKRNRQGQERTMTLKAFARWAGETPPGPRTVPNGEITAGTCARKPSPVSEPGLDANVPPVSNACGEVSKPEAKVYHYPDWLVAELRERIQGQGREVPAFFKAMKEGKHYGQSFPFGDTALGTSMSEILRHHVRALRTKADELEALQHVLARFGEIEESLETRFEEKNRFRSSISIDVNRMGGPGAEASLVKTVEVDGYYSGTNEIRKVLRIDGEKVYYQVVKAADSEDEGANRSCEHWSFAHWYDRRLKFAIDPEEQIKEALKTHLFRRDIKVGSFYLDIEKKAVAQVIDANRVNVTFKIVQVAPDCKNYRRGQAVSWDWQTFMLWVLKEVPSTFEFGLKPKNPQPKSSSQKPPAVTAPPSHFQPGRLWVNRKRDTVVEIKQADETAVTYMIKKTIDTSAVVGHVHTMSLAEFGEWAFGRVSSLASAQLG